jgi:hypothetical protein
MTWTVAWPGTRPEKPALRCGVVDPSTTAVCTRRPRRAGALAGPLASSTGAGGTERAMVVDGYTWTRVPGAAIEVRALTDKPLALRYRPSGH